MSLVRRKIPAYLLTKHNQLLMVCFVSVFALVFINVFKPFGSDRWVSNRLHYPLYSLALVLQGFTIILLSRLVMIRYTRRHEVNYWQYALWIVCELLALSASFTVWSLALGLRHDFADALRVAFSNTAWLLFIPCLIAIIYLSLMEKEGQLKRIKELHAAAGSADSGGKRLIPFYDGRGGLLLSIAKEDLLYIEAADNYLVVWYLKHGHPHRSTLRLTMRLAEEQLKDTHVMRCHRSFFANLEQVKLIRRDKDALWLELGLPNVKDIPVSATYSGRVMAWMAVH